MVEWAWVLICLMVRSFFGKIGRFTSIASDVTVFIGTHLYAYRNTSLCLFVCNDFFYYTFLSLNIERILLQKDRFFRS